MNRDDAIHAALLAKMVGSHLAGVDQLTVERASNNSANKINMQNFVAPILGRHLNPSPQYDMNTPADVIKAYEGLNELALQQVVDPTNSSPVSINSVASINQIGRAHV